jgi:hypothetical protein
MSEDDSEIKGRFATIDQITLQTFIIGVKSEFSNIEITRMKIQKTRSFVPSVRKLVITRPIVFIINHQTLLTLTTLNQIQIL